MDCRIFYHDKCFDGACSAAVFTRFHRERVRSADAYSYHGLVHRAGDLFDESWLTAGENAVVDFKYWPSPRVTWWFDHHQSAFSSAEDEARFRAEQAEGGLLMRKFFDPAYTSCTGLILDVAASKFGFDVSGLSELRHWADIVDGAQYESAKAAVEMEAPAMQITLVIESAPTSGEAGSGLVQQFVPLLAEVPLVEIVAQPFVQAQLGPLMEKHWSTLELIRQRAICERGVIAFDVTDRPAEGYNKFIPYYLHPEGTYNVGLSKSSFRTKISVGTNPWTAKPASELVNIAAICERFGGGGHARVGAISFPVDQVDEARAAAQVIVEELRARER